MAVTSTVISSVARYPTVLRSKPTCREDPANPGNTYCGFNYAGDCADFTPAVPSPYACGTFDAAQGTYGDCHDRSGNGKWPDASKYREVITTYVLP